MMRDVVLYHIYLFQTSRHHKTRHNCLIVHRHKSYSETDFPPPDISGYFDADCLCLLFPVGTVVAWTRQFGFCDEAQLSLHLLLLIHILILQYMATNGLLETLIGRKVANCFFGCDKKIRHIIIFGVYAYSQGISKFSYVYANVLILLERMNLRL